jgi:hypothetical protein
VVIERFGDLHTMLKTTVATTKKFSAFGDAILLCGGGTHNDAFRRDTLPKCATTGLPSSAFGKGQRVSFRHTSLVGKGQRWKQENVPS